jgi:hypothetical protein
VATTRNFTGNGWLPMDATTLSGPNAHVYLDLVDDNTPTAGDEVPPSSRAAWSYPLTTFASVFTCPAPSLFPCTWDSFTASSWQANQKQAATQAFHFVNTFHDHLAAAPISFTAANGAFEGADAVQVEVLDGANTDSGFPDGSHFNDSRIVVAADGLAPRMELRLYTGYRPDGGDVNGADDASLVYRLYAEGMADRLVTDGSGNPALGGIQGRAMREGLGDWYAMDFLVARQFDADTATVGDVNPEYYLAGGPGARPARIDVVPHRGRRHRLCEGEDPAQEAGEAGPGGPDQSDRHRAARRELGDEERQAGREVAFSCRSRPPRPGRP